MIMHKNKWNFVNFFNTVFLMILIAYHGENKVKNDHGVKINRFLPNI